MTDIEGDLVGAGYVRSSNNIHSLPGSLWYASGPGLPSPSSSEEIQVVEGAINILLPKFVGIPYVKGHFEMQTMATFTTVSDMQEWLRANRELSQPGLPAFSNSWD